ncbi:putative secreted protein [Phytophthora infestans]|uniref:Putative secreted protein n=1 Tax=Phytophthora infestans TaxID=4787 RepID=A0A8S9UCB1_PHYIN|nr:putative secreted protein [Phytophthora infestans]
MYSKIILFEFNWVRLLAGPTKTSTRTQAWLLQVKSVTIRSDDRVSAIILEVLDSEAQPSTLAHGGAAKTLTLGEDEHATGIEAHWGKYYGHSRIMYIEFTIDNANTISGETKTNQIGKDTAPKGYQLGGFFGYSTRSQQFGPIFSRKPTAVYTLARTAA